MNEAERRILDLLDKFHNKSATPEELADLERWYASFDNDPKLTSTLSEEKLIAMGDGMLKNIRKDTYKDLYVKKPRKLILKPMLIVALTLIAATTLITIKLSNLKQKAYEKLDVKPGSDVAVLTLSNGKQIDLNLATSGMIYADTAFEIDKESNGVIAYHIKNSGSGVPGINRLSTPSGGKYKLILSDGTKVWLNAISSLEFPSWFDKSERPVSLKGEGYFEVAKNKFKPFFVKTKKETVEVLGTHFNINAYADEEIQRTTLLEGSVRITTTSSNAHKIILTPGEQALGQNNDLTMKNVDAENAVGWKDGYFAFDHTELHALMRELSRWYNVEIVYKGKFKKRVFSGSIDRSYTLREVLNVLELGKVHFHIEPAATANGKSKLLLIP